MMDELILPLSKNHDRRSFSCGNTILDNYFPQQVSQDVKSKSSTCFVIADKDNNLVKGFYTLSSAAISRDLIPPGYQKKFPRYKDLPVTLLGRLAVDEKFKKQGYGEILLIDALLKSLEVSETAVGSIAVIVDPIDKEAKRFYAQYGFVPLPGSGKMFLPMFTIKSIA